MKKLSLLVICLFAGYVQAQLNPNKFQPLTWELPAANECRLASGAPGPKYWQQRADYNMEIALNDETQQLQGTETITYTNHSPHSLTHLWVQLDQNLFHPHSDHYAIMQDHGELNAMMEIQQQHPDRVPGCRVTEVSTGGTPLNYVISGTNMRVDLPKALASGQTFVFRISWNFYINDATIEGRCGYEYFAEDKNYIYELAQFFPRMCVYDDVKGWQNMSYLGAAEFALEFGNYEVKITVPADHVVAATGTLTNEDQVLTEKQRERLALIRADLEKVSPVITPEEATANEKSRSKETRTWIYKAENVRDFAFASSRKFAWDAAAVKVGSKTILAQSVYPKEAVPLWNKYATHAVMTTLKVYSSYTIDYPYPVAIAVHGPVWGMEYPMICFCGGRPESPTYYSSATKYATISVIIHEVGHNFFPMIISNDERRWAWMDEGFNSFFQYLTEVEFEAAYPHRRGRPEDIAYFMGYGSTNPIMTNPESILSNGSTSYGKTSAGLYLLREIIMGRDLFKQAFNEYARRWAYKHPEPADFFRTMQDMSGRNLDWFWRAWFMGTEPVDFAVELGEVEELEEKTWETPFTPPPVEKHDYYISTRPELKDQFTSTGTVKSPRYQSWADLAKNTQPLTQGSRVYEVLFTNAGGCPMPLEFAAVLAGGEVRIYRLPAEVWIKNNDSFLAHLRVNGKLEAIVFNPYGNLPDHNEENDVASTVPAAEDNEDTPEVPEDKKKKNKGK